MLPKYNKMKKIFFLAFIVYLFFASCASRKDFIYLQPEDSLRISQSIANNTIVLQTGDILTISVGADDIRATQPFNPISSYAAGSLQNTNPFIPTYTIDDKGFVDFPKIGKIQLAGKTRLEAIRYIRQEVSRFIVNPTVNIEVRNFRITVLGEVKNPGTYPISNDRITLLEALGLAGDLTINGVRKNVLVIREQDGKKQEFRVDLTSKETLTSPVYYLTQNDVIYVEPNKAKVQSSRYTQNTSVWLSIVSLIITTVSIITR
jgi:polysaccharide export outer membrane protein